MSRARCCCLWRKATRMVRRPYAGTARGASRDARVERRAPVLDRQVPCFKSLGTSLSYRGGFAPSPTGDLHLGSIATALVAWLRARAAGGALVMRVEDIDTPRVIAGMEARQLGDLRWLGFDW